MMKIKPILFSWVWVALFLIPSQKLSADTEIKIVRMSFEIEPVTVMKVTSDTGVGAVRLGPLSPNVEVPSQSLQVSVLSNAHRPYQIYHRMEEDVTNARGIKFPPEKLLFMVTGGKEGGTSAFSSLIKIPAGETLIFRSRPEGGSDIFQILYSVENTKLFEAGLYYGNIYLDIRTE